MNFAFSRHLKKNFLQLVCGLFVSGVNSTYGMSTLSGEIVVNILGMTGSASMLAERIEQYRQCSLVCSRWSQCVFYLMQKVKKDFADLSAEYKARSLREGIFLKSTYEVLSFLLRHGADPHRPCYNSTNGEIGQTGWVYASCKGNVVALKCLIDHGANINSQEEVDLYGQGGFTALMSASCDNDLQSIMLLLNHSADCLIKDSSGKTAYEYARDPIIKRLLQDRMAVQKAGAKDDGTQQCIYGYVKDILDNGEILLEFKTDDGCVCFDNLGCSDDKKGV